MYVCHRFPLRQQSVCVCVLPAMQPTAYTGREYVSMGVRVRLRTEVDVYTMCASPHSFVAKKQS